MGMADSIFGVSPGFFSGDAVMGRRMWSAPQDLDDGVPR